MSGKMLGCGNIVQVPGLPGSNGFDGAAVQMRIDSGFIQWKLADSVDWISLIALSDLTGPAGDSGTAGATGAPGAAAKNIDLQTNATHIQWRYIGEPWQNLVTLASLVGPQGPIGTTGVGIVSIVQTGGTGAPGTINTYTITYTDASTSTFGVYQGADGADGVLVGTAGGVLSGNYPNPGFAVDMATQAELDAVAAAKAPLASPTFTGTVGGITKAMVGLGSVDNTPDASKPVSTAQAAAIATATAIHPFLLIGA